MSTMTIFAYLGIAYTIALVSLGILCCINGLF